MLDVMLYEDSDDADVGYSGLQGRLPRRWSDDITEWCNYSFPEAIRLTESKTRTAKYSDVIGLNGSSGT